MADLGLSFWPIRPTGEHADQVSRRPVRVLVEFRSRLFGEFGNHKYEYRKRFKHGGTRTRTSSGAFGYRM
eukprot:scaffold229822_cov31-Prasinocladus_malaysianus.AAC.1